MISRFARERELTSALFSPLGSTRTFRSSVRGKLSAVLVAAKCPVFYAMLQNNMVEASSGTIEDRDMKPTVLKAVLDSIYKNKIDAKDLKDDPDFAGDLLAAAEMYNMTRLKQICEDVLCDILAVDNVLMYLVIGDRHGATKLKEQALKLIVEKKKEVVSHENWGEFVETYPKLTVEMTKMWF